MRARRPRVERGRRVSGIVDRAPSRVEGRRARDHDHRADDPGEDGAGHDVDPDVRHVLRREALVGDVGQHERESPRRKGAAPGRQVPQQLGEVGGAQALRSGRRELEGVAAHRREVDRAPGDRVLEEALREPPEADAPEHRAQSHFDADGLEEPVRLSEAHVGHPRETLAGEVEHLRVEHVASEQQLVVAAARARNDPGRAELDAVLVDGAHIGPFDVGRRAPGCPYDDSRDDRGGIGESDAEVGDRPHAVSVAVDDRSPDEAAELHPLPVSDAAARSRGPASSGVCRRERLGLAACPSA